METEVATSNDVNQRKDFLEKLWDHLKHFFNVYFSADNIKRTAQDYATLNTLIALVFASFMFFMFYRMGIRKGTERAFATLKKRYTNMEHRKRKIRQYLDWTQSVYSANNFFFGFIGAAEVLIFSIAFYHSEYSHEAVTSPGLTRTALIGGIMIMIICFFTRRIAKYTKERKLKEYTHFHSDEQDLAKDLIGNLGTDLTTLLKTALVELDNKANKAEITRLKDQLLSTQQENLRVKQQLNNQHQELTSKGQQNQQAIQALNAVSNMSAQKENVYKLEITRYKDAMKAINAFEWCEACINAADADNELEKASANPLNIESTNSDAEVLSPPQGKPDQAIEESKEPASLQSDATIPAIKSDGTVSVCTADCLKRYFRMANTVGKEFGEKGAQLNELKRSMTQA